MFLGWYDEEQESIQRKTLRWLSGRALHSTLRQQYSTFAPGDGVWNGESATDTIYLWTGHQAERPSALYGGKLLLPHE